MAEPYGNYRDTDGQPDGDYGGEHLLVRTTPVPDPGDLISRLRSPRRSPGYGTARALSAGGKPPG